MSAALTASTIARARSSCRHQPHQVLEGSTPSTSSRATSGFCSKMWSTSRSLNWPASRVGISSGSSSIEPPPAATWSLMSLCPFGQTNSETFLTTGASSPTHARPCAIPARRYRRSRGRRSRRESLGVLGYSLPLTGAHRVRGRDLVRGAPSTGRPLAPPRPRSSLVRLAAMISGSRKITRRVS